MTQLLISLFAPRPREGRIGFVARAGAGAGLLGLLSSSLLLGGCGRAEPDAGTEPSASPPAESLSIPGPAGADPPGRGGLSAGDLADSGLVVYELRMAPRAWRELEIQPFSNQTYPAAFLAQGTIYEGVRVRHRGAWARSWPKKPLKVFFNEGQPFADGRRLNLNSCWRDPALVREHLAYVIFAACGVPASRSEMVALLLNGEFHGVFVEVEQPDKAFLARRDLKGASIYKATSPDNRADERAFGRVELYPTHYEKETQKDESHEDLHLFCKGLQDARDVNAFFTEHVDLEKYINYLAASVLVQHWDGFNKNHFIFHDERGSKKWFIVPWDLDRTLGDHWSESFRYTRLPVLLGTRKTPGVTGWNRMADRFFNDATLRARFAARLSELLETVFTEEKLFPILDRLEGKLKAAAEADRQKWRPHSPPLSEGMNELKGFIRERRVFLLREAPKLAGEL